jgi:diadenosine tetraphosphate (Ap4A) HIT family hydrolase
MTIVFKVEEVLKLFFTPDKINLSALGNITPHIHWHIIPRFNNDNHFPLSIWSKKKRDVKKEMPRKDEVRLINLIQTALNQ